MKCPTCGYIGFETADRCRNCGYDFGTAAPAPVPDLSMRTGDHLGPLSDLDMAVGRPPEPRSRDTSSADLDRVLQNLDRVLGAAPSSGDLPLFPGAEPRDLPPIVTPPPPPRRPLSVRRTTPNPAKQRPKPVRHAPSAPEPLELPLPEAPDPEARGRAPADALTATDLPSGAPPLRRSLAALIDLAILAGIDAVVVYFTLRLCGLATAELSIVPLVPLAAFFLVLNGGYLVAFTAAGGQTIGKMATGLKVVGQADRPVSTSLSLVRAAGCLGSLCTLGLGYVPALLADGGRALEDRLADTRVIRVAAP